MLDLELRMPPEMGGPGGGTNPEELFAAGFAACFHGALCLQAARAGVQVTDAKVTASVTFGRDPMDGLFTLVASVRIGVPGIDRSIAEALVRDTERICPYAKMARQGIECIVSLEP
jgi:Ohr subfamily peroxiredoxin